MMRNRVVYMQSGLKQSSVMPLRKLTCTLLVIALLVSCFHIGGCVSQGVPNEDEIVYAGLKGNPYLPKLAPNQQEMAVQKGLLTLKPGQSLPRAKYQKDYDENNLPPLGGWVDDTLEFEAYLREAFTEESVEDFIELAAYYQKTVEVYLLRTLRLDLIEEQLINAHIGFPVVYLERRSVYQDRSVLQLNTLYVRITSCHLEYINEDDIALLRQLHTVNGTRVDNEAVALASRTMSKTIIKYDSDGESYPPNTGGALFGGSDGVFYNPYSVVIAFINCEKYTENGELLDQEEELYIKRMDFLLGNLPKMLSIAENHLSMKVTFLIVEGLWNVNRPDWESVRYIIDNTSGMGPEPRER